MPDKIVEKSPAKINLFLKIINRRDDGFHNIRSGITFIDLFDEITVQPHSKFKVIYTGNFAPKNNLFEELFDIAFLIYSVVLFEFCLDIIMLELRSEDVFSYTIISIVCLSFGSQSR